MGESALTIEVADESALAQLAARVAADWRETGDSAGVSVGLCGELGAGKTTWVRAMLRGLGYARAVPSPTYTLMEVYEIDDISLIHMDLYRISGDEALAELGVRDWLDKPRCWIFTEWPQHAPRWYARCDVRITIDVLGVDARRIACVAATPQAERWLSAFQVT